MVYWAVQLVRQASTVGAARPRSKIQVQVYVLRIVFTTFKTKRTKQTIIRCGFSGFVTLQGLLAIGRKEAARSEKLRSQTVQRKGQGCAQD